MLSLGALLCCLGCSCCTCYHVVGLCLCPAEPHYNRTSYRALVERADRRLVAGCYHACRWAIEYEAPAAEAFKLNNPEAAVFCANCNVILRVSDGVQPCDV